GQADQGGVGIVDHCTVLRSETGALEPLIISAMASDRVAKMVDEGDLTHPLPILSRSWSAVVATMGDVLVGLLGPSQGAKFLDNHDVTLRAHRLLLYRIAETPSCERTETCCTGSPSSPRRSSARRASSSASTRRRTRPIGH